MDLMPVADTDFRKGTDAQSNTK